MNISAAQTADLPSILQLQKLCYQENAERYNDYTISPLTQTLDELMEEFNHCLILKVEDGAKIIGSLRGCEKNGSCHIGRVIVHPDYQNRGVATQMMEELERRFPECSKFELFTGYKDEKNIHFYRKLGYNEVNRSSHNGNVRFVYFEKIKGRPDQPL